MYIHVMQYLGFVINLLQSFDSDMMYAIDRFCAMIFLSPFNSTIPP